jgi:hypothetical protein
MRPRIAFWEPFSVASAVSANRTDSSCGDEAPPDLLSGELLDWWLDHGWVKEVPQRRSLYKLFGPFSGCAESEPFTEQEQAAYCLP